MKVLFPDPLTWESGIEYGLEGVAKAQDSCGDVVSTLYGKGPFLEAVAFAAMEFAILDRLEFRSVITEREYRNAELVLLPRVRPGRQGPARMALASGTFVITSDVTIEPVPGRVQRVPSRDWRAIRESVCCFCGPAERR
jgi:hypothetical protein